jgi:hypothetical protein
VIGQIAPKNCRIDGVIAAFDRVHGEQPPAEVVLIADGIIILNLIRAS